MIIRIYESGKLDLETVGDMLWQADAQANFHPEARWINSSTFGTVHRGRQDKIAGTTQHVYREFAVRWIGRESVIMWLTSNQILFEVVSFKILPEEQEAIEGVIASRDFTEPITHMN